MLTLSLLLASLTCAADGAAAADSPRAARLVSGDVLANARAEYSMLSRAVRSRGTSLTFISLGGVASALGAGFLGAGGVLASSPADATPLAMRSRDLTAYFSVGGVSVVAGVVLLVVGLVAHERVESWNEPLESRMGFLEQRIASLEQTAERPSAEEREGPARQSAAPYPADAPTLALAGD